MSHWIISLFIIICVSQDPAIGNWPSSFFSWMVVSILEPGKPESYNQGQMIVYDSSKMFACRYNEQNLMNITKNKPVDYCTENMHYRIEDGSGFFPADKVNCTMNSKYTFEKVSWPTDFLQNLKFLGVDKVGQNDCNHFFSPSVNINGNDYQFDAWTSTNGGSVCKFSMRDLNTNVMTTFAFDGFQSGYPNEALQCTSALIKCAQDNWVCNVKAGVKDSLIIGALGWVCSAGNVDCSPINKGGAHYLPNTARSHGNWAFNVYYQRLKLVQGVIACDFNGICEVVKPNNTKVSNLRQKTENLNFFLRNQFTKDLAC